MRSYVFLAFFLIGFIPLKGFAKGPLQSSMTAFSVMKDQEGKEVFKPVKKAAPGEILEYRLTYKNTDEDPLYNLIVRGPIPYNTVYIGQSAKADVDAKFDVSLDGGKTWSQEPVYKTIQDEQGQVRRVMAEPRDYALLRWTARSPLQPRASMEFVYRVKVK